MCLFKLRSLFSIYCTLNLGSISSRVEGVPSSLCREITLHILRDLLVLLQHSRDNLLAAACDTRFLNLEFVKLACVQKCEAGCVVFTQKHSIVFEAGIMPGTTRHRQTNALLLTPTPDIQTSFNGRKSNIEGPSTIGISFNTCYTTLISSRLLIQSCPESLLPELLEELLLLPPLNLRRSLSRLP